MKEATTKDGIVLSYTKNKERSVNGQYNAMDIYHDGSLVGSRIGAQDLRYWDYSHLFGDDKKLKWDMREEFKTLKAGLDTSSNPGKVEKVKKEEPQSAHSEPVHEVTEEVPKTEETIESDPTEKSKIMSVDKVKPYEQNVKLGKDDENTGYETMIAFRLILHSKRVVTTDDIIECLEKNKKWEIRGYDIQRSNRRITQHVSGNVTATSI